MHKFIPLFCALALIPVATAHAAEPIRIDPNTLAGPDGKTWISRLSQEIRAKNTNLSEDLIVEIADGTITLDAPLRFGSGDGGSDSHSVVFRAAAGAKPVISGGIRISGWAQSNTGLWTVQVSLPDMRHLFVNGVRAQRARGPFPEGAVLYGDPKRIDSDSGFTTPNVAMATWKNHADMELGFHNSWSHMIGKVQSITADGDTARIRMLQPWFLLMARKEGVQAKVPAYIENALELLDEPGEWYFDRPTQTLHYMPREGEEMASATAVVPAIETLLEITGDLDAPAKNIRFEGITFADAAWLDVNTRGLADMQANFTIVPDNLYERDGYLVNIHNEYRKSPGAIRVQHARNITFKNCTFTRLGGAGVDFGLGVQDSSLQSCELHDISGSGIQIGDVIADAHHPKDDRLIVRNIRVDSCTIRDIGVEFEDSIGVFAGYVQDTAITANTIYDLPYTGISIGWGWGEEDAGGSTYPIPYIFDAPTPARNNRIAGNYIHHVMQKRLDGGGIYTLGNMPGTIIEGNHIHDNPGWPGGIYLDEGSGFIEVRGNRVYNVPTAMNYNNRNQDRISTCNVHDNDFQSTQKEP